MADLKLIIHQAIEKVRSGKGTDHDKAIYMLLEQNKKFREKIRKLEENGGKDEVPEYQKTPWYMR